MTILNLNQLSADDLARTQLTPAAYEQNVSFNGSNLAYVIDPKILKDLEKIKTKCEAQAKAKANPSEPEPKFSLDPDHWNDGEEGYSREQRNTARLCREQRIMRSHMMRVIEIRWTEDRIPNDHEQRERRKAMQKSNKLMMVAINQRPFVEQGATSDVEPYLPSLSYIKSLRKKAA